MCRVGLFLVVRTALLVGAVKDYKVVVINSISGEYIGDEFHDCGLSTPVSPTRGGCMVPSTYSLICF